MSKNDTSFRSFLEHEETAALNKSNLSMKRREDLPLAEELTGENAKKA